MVKTKFRTLKDLYANTQEIHLDWNDEYDVQTSSDEANIVIGKDCMREHSKGSSNQVEQDDSGNLNLAFKVPNLNEPCIEANSVGPDAVEPEVQVFDVSGNASQELSFSEKSNNGADQMCKDLWIQDNLMKHERNDSEEVMGASWSQLGFEVNYLSDLDHVKEEDERAYTRMRDSPSGKRLFEESSSYNANFSCASRMETWAPTLELSLGPINTFEDAPESLHQSLTGPLSDWENASRGV